jgi:subtilisin
MKKKLVSILLVCVMLASLLVVSGTVAKPQEAKIPVIIMFKDRPNTELIQQHQGEIKTVYHLKPALAASLPENAITNLRRNPNIEYVVEDKEVFLVEQTLPWGVNRIDADVVHSNGNKGNGINVAIMDTGIDYTHEDLDDNYCGGYDFAGRLYQRNKNDANPMDYAGHGTHCAGIVAAVDNDIGVVGVAPEAKLWAVKVFDDRGNGVYSDTIEGFEWCIDTHSDGDPDNDIQVISMSFGSAGEYTPLNEWLEAAYAEGIVLVGAAGNEYAGDDTVIYPARHDKVIAVAATDHYDDRAIFSSTGPAVELAAPGVNIPSTVPDGGYEAWSGTSMACPHVAGTAALVIASGITDNEAVRARLNETAEDLGDTEGRDPLFGYGLVDAEKAVLPAGNQLPVADAGDDLTVVDEDNNGVETVTLNGSGSYDPDGTIVTYEWTEGDTQLGMGVQFTHDFSVGTHVVTLTVTDDDDATDVDEVIITVTSVPSGDTMHVQSIIMDTDSRTAGKNTFVWAIATVTIVDDSDNPVEGATVYGTWSGATSDSDSGTTDASGLVSLTSGSVKLRTKTLTFIFTVDDVVKDGWDYDSAGETSDSISVEPQM